MKNANIASATMSIMELSQVCRDNRFPFWNNCDGTFGSILFNAMREKGINPRSVYVNMDTQTVQYKGKIRKFRKRNVVTIIAVLERIDNFIMIRNKK